MSAVSKVSRAKAVQLWEGLARAHSTMTAALEKDMLPEAGVPLSGMRFCCTSAASRKA